MSCLITPLFPPLHVGVNIARLTGSRVTGFTGVVFTPAPVGVSPQRAASFLVAFLPCLRKQEIDCINPKRAGFLPERHQQVMNAWSACD